MERILQYLRQHGEQLDMDLAKALRLPLDQVQRDLDSLSASGDVMTCQVTRFNGPKKIEGRSCRIAGFVPPYSPGRKPGTTPAAS